MTDTQAGAVQAVEVDLIARGMTWEETERHMREACAQAGVQWDEEKEPQSIAINVMQRLANAAHKTGFRLGLERAALSATQPSAAPGDEALPLELRGITEALENKDGCWRSCSGCHELNEGHNTGPYSAVLKCSLGAGCSECGGIGAVWDTTNYADMAAFSHAAPGDGQGATDGSTPGPWRVEKRERDGEMVMCWVAAPDCNGFAYAAEILGDDEYRDGEEATAEGMPRRLADCELIVKAVAFYRASLAAPGAATAAREQEVEWGDPKTVGMFVRQLQTIAPETPIHAAVHTDIDGKRVALTKPVTISRERVDGRRIRQGDESVPYSIVIWAQQDELAASPAAAPTSQPNAATQEQPSEKQKKLYALADRIDHEELWRVAGMDRSKFTLEQKDRLDAGVALRRYGQLWAPGRWIVFPPVGNVHFSASTLDKVYEMAKKRENNY